VILHVRFLGLFKENFNLNSSFNSVYSFLLAISTIAIPKQSMKRSYTPFADGRWVLQSIFHLNGLSRMTYMPGHLKSSKQSSHPTYIDNRGLLLVFTLFFIHVSRYQLKQ
jgi:hypothetical protein